MGESVATVSASTISDVGYVGILVEGGSAAVASTIVVRAEDTGILALFGAQLDVRPGSQVRYGNVGIQLEGSGTAGHVDGSSIAEMKSPGS